MTSTTTPLQRLHSERAEAAGELSKLNEAAARLRNAATGEAAAMAEITALGAAEIAAMSKWVSDGCAGDLPAPDQKQRRALAEKLAAAQSAATAAKGAGANIDHQIGDLNIRLRAIGSQIEKAALDALQVEFGDLNSQHLTAVEAVRKVTAKLLGLCSYLTNEGRRKVDSGDVDGGKQYLARAEALNRVKLASVGSTQGEIIEAANDWSRRAATLRAGK